MTWLKRWSKRARLLVRKDSVERELDQEMQLHLDLEIEKNVRAGMTAVEARRQAHISFGGVERYKQQSREARTFGWVAGMSLDMKLGVRMLFKHPWLSIVGGLGMAVAIAIGSASFTIVRSLLTDWLPEDDAHRIVKIENGDIEGRSYAWQTTLQDMSLWRALSGVEELGALRRWSRNVAFPDGVQRALVVEMTASTFRAIRAAPFMGRMLEDADERQGGPPIAVIGYAVWHDRFRSDPQVIGKSVSLGGTPYTVIGVMPEGFMFPDGAHIWTPLTLRAEDYPAGAGPDVSVVARMAPESTLEGVQAELEALGVALAAAQPETHGEIRARVLPFARQRSPEDLWVILAVQAMTGLIVLIIGINVAILVYARTANRVGEIAIRTALGGSRARVVVQLFSEALVLSSLAAAVGLAAGQYALSALGRYLTLFTGGGLPYWYSFRLDALTYGYVAALTLLAAVIVGVVPALKATGRAVHATLQRVTSSSSTLLLGRSWTTLIITQVGVAVWALPFALSNLTSVFDGRGEAPLFRTSEFVTASLQLDRRNLGATFEPQEEFKARFHELEPEVVRRLEADPSVAQVVRTGCANYTTGCDSSGPPAGATASTVEVAGRMDRGYTDVRPKMFTAAAVLASLIDPHRRHDAVAIALIEEDFFSAFGVPILAGRDFTVRDMSSEATAVIVNRRFAQDVFHGDEALGRRIRVRRRFCFESCNDDQWLEIVGVVPDFPSDHGASVPAPTVYRPLIAAETYPITLTVRGAGASPGEVATRMREIALSVDPSLTFPSITPLDEAIDANESALRLASLILTLLPLSALLLSAAGIAALMAFTVEQRRREIGIRLALGAGGRHVLASVLSRATLQIGAGVAVGLVFVTAQMWAASRFDLRGVQLLGAVVAVVTLVGLAATLGPARRGMRIQPTEALKGE